MMAILFLVGRELEAPEVRCLYDADACSQVMQPHAVRSLFLSVSRSRVGDRTDSE